MYLTKKSILILVFLSITGMSYAQTGWVKTGLNLNGAGGYNLYTTDTGIYAATQNGIYLSNDYGDSWLAKGPTDNGNWACDVIKSNQYLLAATRFGIYRSSDNGDSWLPTSFTSTFSQNGHIFAKNSTHVFFIKWAEGIFRSSDDGQSWEQVYVGQYAPGYQDYAASAVGICTIGGKIVIGLNSGSGDQCRIYISSDNGNTWTGSFPSSNPIIDQFLCVYYDNGKLFTGGYMGVSLSTDLGNSWTSQCRITYGTHGEVIGLGQFRDFISYNQNLIAAVDFNSIKISGDNGINWTSFNDGLSADMTFSSFAIKPPYIFGITQMPGEVYRRPLTEIITNVEENTNPLPSRYSLSQNYPNPFNPTTKIKYSISNSGIVLIKVYDVLGKEVKILLDEYKDAGAYEIEFSAGGGSILGGNAGSLASGIYFYKIVSGNYSEIKKMILLR